MTKFTSITVWQAFLPFRLSFRHNLAERKGTETLLIRIGTDDGKVGFGQVLPRSYLTGETVEGALADISERWWPRLRGVEITENLIENVLSPLFREADSERRNAGYAGIDVAASMAARLYGSEEGFANIGKNSETHRLELIGVIPATGVRKASILARLFTMLGYRRFKVKVGRDAEADEKRVGAVRRIIGKDAWLLADANAAWEWDEAEERMSGLGRKFGVSLVEEPLKRDIALTSDFKELEHLSGVETMADESLCSTADAQVLLERGSPSWWNIRLAKNGGFTGVNHISRRAHDKGIRLYGGILVGETGALAAAGRYSFFTTGVECGEYGFSRIFVKGDPFRGVPGGYFGYYSCPKRGREKVVSAENSRIPGRVVFFDTM